MKNIFLSLVLGLFVHVASCALGQDLAKNANPETKPVIEADLTIAEATEGRRILLDLPAEAQRLGQLAQKVIENPTADSDAKLLAYEMREIQQQRLYDLKEQQSRYVARVQDRTGCKSCEFFDFNQKKIFLKNANAK